MLALKRTLLGMVFVTVAAAQSADPPLSDTRLTVHTLVREDIFAALLADDTRRLARGEKNIERLLEMRPNARAELLAWSGTANLYRAVRAHESNNTGEFQKYIDRAFELFSEAFEISPQNGAVASIVGGSFVTLGDRLPEEKQSAGWARAYDSYKLLWRQQERILERLPMHIRGELLGGLAQSAQRTGRHDEVTVYVDKILEVLKDTPYEPAAKEWKSNPASARDNRITCLSCHDGGRLSARIAEINN